MGKGEGCSRQINKYRLKSCEDSVGIQRTEFNMAEVKNRAKLARHEVERNYIMKGVLGHVGNTWLYSFSLDMSSLIFQDRFSGYHICVPTGLFTHPL